MCVHMYACAWCWIEIVKSFQLWKDKGEKKNTRGRPKKNSLGEDMESVSDESTSDDLTKKGSTTTPCPKVDLTKNEDPQGCPAVVQKDDSALPGEKPVECLNSTKDDLTKNEDSHGCPAVVQKDDSALPGEKPVECLNSTKDDLTKNEDSHGCPAVVQKDDSALPGEKPVECLNSTKDDLTKNEDSHGCSVVIQTDDSALPGEKNPTSPHPPKDDLTKNALENDGLADQLKRSFSFIDVGTNDTSSGVSCWIHFMFFFLEFWDLKEYTPKYPKQFGDQKGIYKRYVLGDNQLAQVASKTLDVAALKLDDEPASHGQGLPDSEQEEAKKAHGDVF